MKHFQHLAFVAILVFSFVVITGCNRKRAEEEQSAKLEEKVFVVNIVHDSLKLKEYLNYHKEVWPQVEAGFKKAGYKKIALYRYQYLLVMTVTVPAGADLNKMGKLAESYHPRCAEWNRLMSTYQTGVAGTSSAQTWTEAKPFYIFNNR